MAGIFPVCERCRVGFVLCDEDEGYYVCDVCFAHLVCKSSGCERPVVRDELCSWHYEKLEAELLNGL